MAKIMTVDDFPLYAEMLSDFLVRHGNHDVHSGINPIVIDEVLEFDPDVIVVTVVRKLEMLGHGPLHDFYTEVDGAKSFRDIARASALAHYPILVASIGVKESEIPQDLRYVMMAHIPHSVDLLLNGIEKILEAKRRGSNIAEA